MAERKKRTARWSRLKRILKTAIVAEKGQLACFDTADGALVAAIQLATVVPIGYFEESFTGNGTLVASVTLFSEIDVQYLPLSATTPPTDADVGKVVYLRADGVTTTATTAGVVGRVWGADSGGAWVQSIISGGAVS